MKRSMLSSRQMIILILSSSQMITSLVSSSQMIHLILSQPDITPIEKENVIIQPDDSIDIIIQQDDTPNIYSNVIIQPNDNTMSSSHIISNDNCNVITEPDHNMDVGIWLDDSIGLHIWCSHLARCKHICMLSPGGVNVYFTFCAVISLDDNIDVTVRYHCEGWSEEVNSCILISYMVYL